MAADFDWLGCLSLLNPRCGLGGGGGGGGLPRVTREDVLAALSGIDPLSELLVYSRLGMLSAGELADKSVDGAFVLALRLYRADVVAFSVADFAIAWRVACLHDAVGDACRECGGDGCIGVAVCMRCKGSGRVVRSDASMMRDAGVSNNKWGRIKPLYLVSQALLAASWGGVVGALRDNLKIRKCA
jgi:hypothetical protein